MAAIDFKKIPRFKKLPIRKDAPPESSWGVFGDDEQPQVFFEDVVAQQPDVVAGVPGEDGLA